MATTMLGGYILGAGIRPVALIPPTLNITFGREAGNMIQVEDVLSSRRHCVVQWAPPGKAIVKDLGSSNGTYLNNAKLEKNVAQDLKNGDTIRIGGHMYTYITGDENQARATQNKQQMSDAATYVQIDAVAVQAAANALNSGTKETDKQPVLGGSASPTILGDDQTMAGSLSVQGVVQLLQFIDSNAKTGEVMVQGKACSGYMAFKNGHVFHAVAKVLDLNYESGQAVSGALLREKVHGVEKTGFDALFAMASELEGKFVLKGLPTPPNKELNIIAPTMMSMLECCRRMDDAKRG